MQPRHVGEFLYEVKQNSQSPRVLDYQIGQCVKLIDDNKHRLARCKFAQPPMATQTPPPVATANSPT